MQEAIMHILRTL